MISHEMIKHSKGMTSSISMKQCLNLSNHSCFCQVSPQMMNSALGMWTSERNPKAESVWPAGFSLRFPWASPGFLRVWFGKHSFMAAPIAGDIQFQALHCHYTPHVASYARPAVLLQMSSPHMVKAKQIQEAAWRCSIWPASCGTRQRSTGGKSVVSNWRSYRYSW